MTYLYLCVPSSLVWKLNLEALEAWVFSNFLPLLPRYRHFISAFRCLSLASVINKARLQRFTSRCRRSNPHLIRRFSLYTEDWPEFGTQKDGTSVSFAWFLGFLGETPTFFIIFLHLLLDSFHFVQVSVHHLVWRYFSFIGQELDHRLHQHIAVPGWLDWLDLVRLMSFLGREHHRNQ